MSNLPPSLRNNAAPPTTALATTAAPGVIMPPPQQQNIAPPVPYVAPYYGRMNLYPASALSAGFGIKTLIYSQPGAGKTPLMATLPDAVGCISEPGLLSLRNSNVPCALAFSHNEFVNFVKWAIGSNEARLYNNFFFDSVSQSCEINVEDQLSAHSHGLKAYGEMEREMMIHLKALYYAPRLNVTLIAKQDLIEVGGVGMFRPYFPGKALNIRVPHLYDEVLRLEVQQNGSKMIRTKAAYNCVARDRSGRLAELEPADLGAVYKKILA